MGSYTRLGARRERRRYRPARRGLQSFGDNLVLDGVDLSVDPGEVLVIIGPSGSGKNTLLRCVNLLEPIQAGRIFLEGKEITRKGVNVSAILFFLISFPLTRLAAYLERRLT